MIALALWAGMFNTVFGGSHRQFLFGYSFGSPRFPDMYADLGNNLRHAYYTFDLHE